MESWEYFASGAERECRLMPTADQAPVANVNNSTGVRFGKDQVSFYLYDHLGNTRLNYTPTGFISHPGDPTIAVNKINTVVDYFPYAKVLREFVNGDHERYLTTQHERDQETDLDYRGARYYDTEVGRFLSLDPLAADFPAWSAYNYVMGNPVAFVDPDGKEPKPPKQAISTLVVEITITLMELDFVSEDDRYGSAVYTIEATEYDDGSVSFQAKVQTDNVTGVGIMGSVTYNADGIVTGLFNVSEGNQTVNESNTVGASISAKVPGTDVSGSLSTSSTSSYGVQKSGASGSAGFTLVYDAINRNFDITDNISGKEASTISRNLKDAESFPSDEGLPYGPKSEQMLVLQTTSKTTITPH